jgi:putative two-component system response regulator
MITPMDQPGMAQETRAGARLLIVDDEELNRELLEGMVECLGHEAESARDGQEALTRLSPAIDLVLLDVMMPGMDGLEVARRIRIDPEYGDLPIIMVTALANKADRLRAVEAGANDFIAKPVDLTELRVRTTSLLKMKAAQDAVKRHQVELEALVQVRTTALRHALTEVVDAQQETQQAHLDTIRRLGMAAECRDGQTAAHLERVGHYCAVLARRLGLPEREVEILRYASLMHDVGKIGTPDAILRKPGPLTAAEREVMQQHTLIGARLLRDSASELLRAGEIIVLSHHEKWDGSGYPKGLKGEEIPLYGRICAVADVFDALTSRRPYKEACSNEQAYAILRSGRGSHFDPHILDLFFAHLDEIVAVQQQYRDEP